MSSNWASAVEIIAFFVIAMGFGIHQLWKLKQFDKADAAGKTDGSAKKSTPAQPNL